MRKGARKGLGAPIMGEGFWERKRMGGVAIQQGGKGTERRTEEKREGKRGEAGNKEMG